MHHFTFIDMTKKRIAVDEVMADSIARDGFRGEGLLSDTSLNALETYYRHVRAWQEVAGILLVE